MNASRGLSAAIRDATPLHNCTGVDAYNAVCNLERIRKPEWYTVTRRGENWLIALMVAACVIVWILQLAGLLA